ncbi:wall-associated receptor kinase-like 9 [Ipomoea triloba]|uniref:wall-associated receptor kinase-like 9 n=1 Tax=Ipomoea triloba TaxID=35885 RepID=UPI00125DDFB4|nr:wall-associated receptor kinase-like 9 [Ipomoea triloba]
MKRSAGKEIVLATMLMMSFIVMLTLAAEYEISWEFGNNYYDSYRESGIPMVPKSCRGTCGNISIFYPFRIGPDEDCYLNKWFLVNCVKSSHGLEKPFLSSFSDDKDGVREIVSISYESQVLVMKEWFSPLCQTTTNLSVMRNTKLSGTPFFYSSKNNRFMFYGCGSAVLTTPPPPVPEFLQSSCKSSCSNNTTTPAPKFANDCNGINCCHLSFHNDVNAYQINIAANSSIVNASCNYAFFPAIYSARGFSLQTISKLLPEDKLVVPVFWTWAVTIHDLMTRLPHYSRDCGPYNNMFPQELRRTYATCGCKYPLDGNAYLPNGCQGVSASFGLVSLIWACVILYKAIKKRKMKKLRQKFFKRNGGLLLQQQLLAKEGTVEKTKIFTASELDKATDHFNADRIVGRGGQGTVYKGMLIDGQIVAVKKSQVVDENQLEPFINEVVILSQINHRNVVKLMGCCLETEVPILVYEFIPNGTLFGLIQNNFDDELIPLSWDIRLRIASDVTCALAYLHSATSVPIYHRDIKSGNILLDEKFRAKVSDFGISRSISIDKTHLTTIVKGTFDYLDPEYFQTSQFTEKSDVYSFGVVLAELLTGQKPISFELDDDEDRSLVSRFLLSMEENRLMEILDVEVIEQGKKEDVVAMAWLAQRCLNMNGKKRPTMKEVASELDTIKASHSHLPSAMEALEIESDFIA